jgi:hypothetical protein
VRRGAPPVVVRDIQKTRDGSYRNKHSVDLRQHKVVADGLNVPRYNGTAYGTSNRTISRQTGKLKNDNDHSGH